MNIKLIVFALGLAIIPSISYAMERKRHHKKGLEFKNFCSDFKVINQSRKPDTKLICCDRTWDQKNITSHINRARHIEQFKNGTHKSNFTISQCSICFKYFSLIQSLEKHRARNHSPEQDITNNSLIEAKNTINIPPINQMALSSLLNSKESYTFEKFEFPNSS